jgi:hypothetical protein
MSVGTNEYQYLSVPIVNASNTYFNPMTGLSEIGDCTVPGQGASGPCPWPANMLGRNTFRMPNNWGMDLGLYKNIAVTERVKMQFRFETYNTFNHPNNYVDSGTIDVSSSVDPSGNNGLVYVKKYDKRDVQLALRITF